MFYFRLNKVRILNNRELLGKAEIQIMSFLTSGETDFPMLDDFFRTNDEAQKKELIKEAITKVISSRIMPTMQKIKDKQSILFGNTGYIIYKSETIPSDMNWMLLAIESDRKTRTNAELIESTITDKNITSAVGAIASLASLSNPVTAAIATLSTIVADSLVKIYKNDRDDQVGLLLTSFIEKKDYPYGKMDAQDVIDTTRNMFVDFTIFSY